MKCRISSPLGEILIDTEVIEKFAGTIAVESMGIVGMASTNVKDGLVRLLRKENLTKGIHVKVGDNKINIDFHVIISYGVNISAVCENLIETVKDKVEEFTGIPVGGISIYVDGVREID